MYELNTFMFYTFSYTWSFSLKVQLPATRYTIGVFLIEMNRNMTLLAPQLGRRRGKLIMVYHPGITDMRIRKRVYYRAYLNFVLLNIFYLCVIENST